MIERQDYGEIVLLFAAGQTHCFWVVHPEGEK